MKSPVKLYLRVRLPDGSYPYLKPAYASNGRIRPHCAIYNGKAVPFPGSTYYLRYTLEGKRVWEPAGSDPSQAEVNLQKKANALQAAALGMPTPTPAPTPAPMPIPISHNKRLLADCAAKYIRGDKGA
jgi:hypothetical protein